jgi:hypothetical protein
MSPKRLSQSPLVSLSSLQPVGIPVRTNSEGKAGPGRPFRAADGAPTAIDHRIDDALGRLREMRPGGFSFLHLSGGRSGSQQHPIAIPIIVI